MIWFEARFADSRPRAIAALTRRFRDVDLAEEAFGDACVKALSHWRKNGTPNDPLAWLLVVARTCALDRLRKQKRADLLPEDVFPMEIMDENAEIDRIDRNGLRDDVLHLLFICCHPALARRDQLAVALKIVVGMGVPEIARAFLVKPKTMEQRITRAKQTISANPVPFATPDMQERARRLDEVSLMIYLLFNEGWSSSASAEQFKLPLCEEAIRLARLLLQLFPGLAKLMGLLALLLYQHSRRHARIDGEGNLIALGDQDRGLWDRSMIAEAGSLLEKAERHGSSEAYQLQAAIAGVHARASSADATDWIEIEALYGALHLIQPTPIVRLNQAAAVAKARGAERALDMLAPLAEPLADYRWLHAMRGTLLQEIGDMRASMCAYRRALELGPTEPERRHLIQKIEECEKNI